MSVSDNHGGGLTLQQVLSDDLKKLNSHISVGWFGRAHVPNQKLGQLSSQIDLPLDAFFKQSKIGKYLKARIRRWKPVLKWEQEVLWKKLKKLFRHRKPRLLVCPQSALTVELTSRAVQELGAEYITWVMDDHPLNESGKAMSYTKEYEKKWAEHLQTAQKVFVISNEMKTFYLNRFFVDSEVLHGAVPLSARKKNCRKTVKRSEKTFILGYAGSLSGWQQDGIEMLINVLKETGGKLSIAGPIKPAWLKTDNVNFLGKQDSKTVLSILKQCDAVVLPISFKPEFTAMSCLNIATKLSEMCACGRPILAIGPSNAAMIKILLRHNAAVCVTKPSKKNLKKAIKKILNKNIAKKVTQNAKNIFRKELNLETMKKKWSKASRWLFKEY